uniref:Uncharacterized protein n=1 Tax=Salix viminalis TaxID=40686 RepID=A0A6N2KFQ7_SALVM
MLIGLQFVISARSSMVIKELKSLGSRAAMLTGDSEAAAMYAQEQAIDTGHVILMSNDLGKPSGLLAKLVGKCGYTQSCWKISGALHSHKHGNKNSSHNHHSDCFSVKKVKEEECGTQKCCSSQKVEKVQLGCPNSSLASVGCSSMKVETVQSGAPNPICSSGCCSIPEVEKGVALARKLRKRRAGLRIQAASQDVVLPRKLTGCCLRLKVQGALQNVALAR